MMKSNNILLCVTGGIAVYKAAALTSKLTQAGYDVKVIMSESATKFVTPLTFQALSRWDVYTDTFAEKDPSVISHIDLADWADLVLVAPATANVIGKMANGIADDMMTTTLLATTAEIWIAPAMNVHMYDHPAVKRNLATLHADGIKFIEPDEGYLACGYVGKGRLAEPEQMVSLVKAHFSGQDKFLTGKNVLITAGPTQEKLDPIRFFTNRSTGKMGYALAEVAEQLGANVTLVSGPSSLQAPSRVQKIDVLSAQEMYDAVMNNYANSDIVIKAAAVADFRPKQIHPEKIKKGDGVLHIEMERTLDILKALGEQKGNQILVGFAAETENLTENARKKLISKNMDMIVANNVKQQGAGFAVDTNVVTIFKREGHVLECPLSSKTQIARTILEEIHGLLESRGL